MIPLTSSNVKANTVKSMLLLFNSSLILITSFPSSLRNKLADVNKPDKQQELQYQYR